MQGSRVGSPDYARESFDRGATPGSADDLEWEACSTLTAPSRPA
jgi:hypothetical protein